MKPSYLSLSQSDWRQKKLQAVKLLKSCKACPRCCGVNRLLGQQGFCKNAVKIGSDKNSSCDNSASEVALLESSLIALSAAVLHQGEEPVFGGTKGVGNFFFYYCNGSCIFCQNWEISQPEHEVKNKHYFTATQLAKKMVKLQSEGATHIGLVSPTHIAPFLIVALQEAVNLGLRIPIIYNSNGYDSIETLKLLEDIVSIYLPDFKYGDDEAALKYSGFVKYKESAARAIAEMVRQVGSTIIEENGLAQRGVIVRHLVLPEDKSSTNAVFNELSFISTKLPISLMAQYHPCYKAVNCKPLDREITKTEYEAAKTSLRDNFFYNGYEQELESSSNYLPNFANSDKIFS